MHTIAYLFHHISEVIRITNSTISHINRDIVRHISDDLSFLSYDSYDSIPIDEWANTLNGMEEEDLYKMFSLFRLFGYRTSQYGSRIDSSIDRDFDPVMKMLSFVKRFPPSKLHSRKEDVQVTLPEMYKAMYMVCSNMDYAARLFPISYFKRDYTINSYAANGVFYATCNYKGNNSRIVHYKYVRYCDQLKVKKEFGRGRNTVVESKTRDSTELNDMCGTKIGALFNAYISSMKYTGVSINCIMAYNASVLKAKFRPNQTNMVLLFPNVIAPKITVLKIHSDRAVCKPDSIDYIKSNALANYIPIDEYAKDNIMADIIRGVASGGNPTSIRNLANIKVTQSEGCDDDDFSIDVVECMDGGDHVVFSEFAHHENISFILSGVQSYTLLSKIHANNDLNQTADLLGDDYTSVRDARVRIADALTLIKNMVYPNSPVEKFFMAYRETSIYGYNTVEIFNYIGLVRSLQYINCPLAGVRCVVDYNSRGAKVIEF